jgi:hypothetical protein
MTEFGREAPQWNHTMSQTSACTARGSALARSCASIAFSRRPGASPLFCCLTARSRSTVIEEGEHLHCLCSLRPDRSRHREKLEARRLSGRTRCRACEQSKKVMGAMMVTECSNPFCGAPFRYLEDGRLFRLENDRALGSSSHGLSGLPSA